MALPQQPAAPTPAPLFGIVPAGLPVFTDPVSMPSSTSFLYSIPTAPRAFSHVVVFLLPGVTLPPGTAAAIYLVTTPSTSTTTAAAAAAAGNSALAPAGLQPQQQQQQQQQQQLEEEFRFLGGVGPGKESAVFRVNPTAGANVVLGVAVEDAASVAHRLAVLQAARPDPAVAEAAAAAVTGTGTSASGGARGTGPEPGPGTLMLAQRIIRNAFNFLAGFSGTAGQVEVVPLRAFEDWWRKFESRIRSDPGFLERDD